jgi:hypothetical protein
MGRDDVLSVLTSHGTSTKYGLEGYSVINPAYVISLLYCLVVVPKELWLTHESELLHAGLARLQPEKLFELERVDPLFSKRPAAELIRHLRNSVAHADFSVDQDGRFRFFDQSKHGTEPRFIASITLGNMERFLTIVGGELANTRASLRLAQTPAPAADG